MRLLKNINREDDVRTVFKTLVIDDEIDELNEKDYLSKPVQVVQE